MDTQVQIKGIQDGLLVSLPEGAWEEVFSAILLTVDERLDFFRGARIALQVSERDLGATELSTLRAELGKREMEQIGLLKAAEVVDGAVVRQRKAYPVYNGTYAQYLATIKAYLASFGNLQTVGRNGLHKYNNQDHSMLTAMLAVRNLLGEQHDVWSVNTDRSYHEEMRLPPHSALSADEAGT